MLNIFRAALVFGCCIVCLGVGTHTPAQRRTLPSTLSFIKSKTASYGSTVQFGNGTTYASYLNFEGCTLLLYRRHSGGPCAAGDSYMVEMAALDAASVKVVAADGMKPGFYRLSITTVGRRGAVKFRSQCSAGGETLKQESRSGVELYFNDEAVARRVASAFKYAIPACRREEPF